MAIKTEFTYPSADGRTQIHAIRWMPEVPPIGIVQIAHGMVEFIDRYDDFARHLCAHGYIVTGNDHLGHGASVTTEADWGFFADTAGADCVLADMLALLKITGSHYPGLPYILFGHSMGSFFSRRFLAEHGDALSGAIICGTGRQPGALLALGKGMTHAIAAVKGWRHRSPLVDSMAFGGMNKRFEPARTAKDWLSSDETVVDAYLAEPRCTFLFTLDGYRALFDTMQKTQRQSLLQSMPKTLPVLFIAGEDDPVGGFGSGVRRVADSFVAAGMERVDVRLYPGFRHEILNEIGRETVYADVVAWLVPLSNGA